MNLEKRILRAILNRIKRQKLPWGRARSAPYGTVYLMQDKHQPRLIKVGYTKRRTIDRRAELNRVAGDDMRIRMTLSMPWAAQVEQKALRHLRRKRRLKSDHRGTEWFWLPDTDALSDIETILTNTATKIQKTARLKLSWPKNTQIKMFKPRSGLKSATAHNPNLCEKCIGNQRPETGYLLADTGRCGQCGDVNEVWDLPHLERIRASGKDVYDQDGTTRVTDPVRNSHIWSAGNGKGTPT
jgi:hypothetical protein